MLQPNGVGYWKSEEFHLEGENIEIHFGYYLTSLIISFIHSLKHHHHFISRSASRLLSVYSIPSIMLEHMSMLTILVLTATPKNMPYFPHFINKIGSVKGSDLPQSQGNI